MTWRKRTIMEMAREAWAEAGEGWVVGAWFDDRAKAFEAFAAMVRADALEKSVECMCGICKLGLQRKSLTDKQILADETLRYYFGQNGGAGPVSKQGRKVIDAIEAAHGIKE